MNKLIIYVIKSCSLRVEVRDLVLSKGRHCGLSIECIKLVCVVVAIRFLAESRRPDGHSPIT